MTLDTAGGRAVIRVQDNGPGVPAAMREVIFERFRQVEGGAERRFGGTGLGLTIVKEFVGLHGGAVEVAEAPGGGALFTVTLPLVAPAGTEIQPMPSTLDEEIDRQALDELRRQNNAAILPTPALAANVPLVLVVEDNPDMNAFVAEALRRHYRVVTAFDGEEGLRKALETRPDLIVSDVMMPRMSGDQMVGALRRRREMDDVPIVLLTAKADDELRVKLLKEGAQDYVYKPFSVEELLARVGGLISERRRSHEALRESEEQHRIISESVNDALIAIDQESRIIYFANNAVEKIFGYAPSELLGKEITVLMPDRFHDLHRAGVKRYLETGVRHLNWKSTQTTGLHKSGKEIPLEISYGEYTRGGKRYFIGAVRDVTERHEAEEKIRRLNEELERRVVERTAQLEATNKELEAFSYSVSHDLRAPLRAIDGFSQALLENYRVRLDAEGQDALQRVRAGAQRMAELIDDLLQLSRVTRAEMYREAVDLSALAESVVRDLQRAEPARRVEVAIQPDLRAEGDAKLLRIALVNLLSNAWKFTGPRSAARIELGLQNGGERAFFVRDNGAGFDMAYAGKLFGAFQRLHDASKFTGTGIGLATVQRIVNRHGGRVWAEAAVDQGATFYFTLP